MKALVTGATGLVGKHLTLLLCDMGIPVVAMGRNQEELEYLKNKGAQPLEFDLTVHYRKYDQLNEFEGEDYVWFHCAAAITGASDDILDEVNIRGTQKLVDKASELNIKRFILVSSVATYGVGHSAPINEETKQLPGSNYGQSKVEQERIVHQSQLNYTIFRPPFITGPYDENFMVEFATRIENNKMPTISKPGVIGIIDARDLAKVMILAARNENTMNKKYNIQGTSIVVEDFITKLGSYLQIDPPYGPHYPYWLAMTIGTIVGFVTKLRGKSPERGLSRYRIKSLTSNRSLNTEKIKSELGFEPQYSLDDSIRDWLNTRKNM